MCLLLLLVSRADISFIGFRGLINQLKMSSTIPIADPEEMEICPYDASHRVQSRRMVYHLEKCRKNFIGQKKSCPFNGKHRVPAPELNYHMNNCPDKAMIDQDLRYSGMKQSGLNDDLPCGDLKVPDDDFGISSEENWESETVHNRCHFRLGQKTIESSFIPSDKYHNEEQLRLPLNYNSTTQAPVYRFSTMPFQNAGLGRGRGRGRGIVLQANDVPKPELNNSYQQNNIPIGRGRGLSKVATAHQQWQKSDSKIVSVKTVTPENISIGIGRGIKKDNIECNHLNKRSKVCHTLEDLEKHSRRVQKKLNQISKLKQMKNEGTLLDKDEEIKLAKEKTLEEEYKQILSKIESWHIK